MEKRLLGGAGEGYWTGGYRTFSRPPIRIVGVVSTVDVVVGARGFFHSQFPANGTTSNAPPLAVILTLYSLIFCRSLSLLSICLFSFARPRTTAAPSTLLRRSPPRRRRRVRCTVTALAMPAMPLSFPPPCRRTSTISTSITPPPPLLPPLPSTASIRPTSSHWGRGRVRNSNNPGRRIRSL